ncbi:MAG: short-chain dehydrogenase [Syntrophaceae bacterium CG2_30_49_12]|nr:MAG: short-chain dehydrogenase [Syntrophaceae bacterium CG2_30_49_12]PJA50273.1 MAG: short-chain dehydrogenase [Syntrophobacterales bacterium CG_4_9_14_3_um_filter_49_8]PJC74544.1 MAG: short-chain dehydrogenase [Syntrophobacterales bacterium CG_4_8_14_3_um_filter_49_14]
MDLNLAGKTVIVTGGGSNIGRAICHRFAEEKANVVIAEWDESQGSKVAEEVKKLGAASLFVKTDVTNNNEVVEMVKKATARFGQVDILVNNVGWAVDQLFMEETREKWEKMIAIDFWGMINCTRAVLDRMVEQKKGAIVSIGSDAGRMGEYREAIYAGCKGGVIALTKALAREVGRFGIRLNVVCPGLTVPQEKEAVGEKSLWSGEMMDMFTPEAQAKAAKAYPLRKIGKADDVANAVVFMASDRAGHITGQTLSVSGGYTMM